MTNTPRSQIRDELAEALGFNFVCELNEHRKWLEDMQIYQCQIKAALARSRDGEIIVIRGLDLPVASTQ